MENELIYCHKCKKRTENIDSQIVQTRNRLRRIAVKCLICKTNKSKFVKKLEKEIKSDIKKKLSEEDPIIKAKKIHAQIRKKFHQIKIMLGIDDLWAADVVVISNNTDQNDNYKYMLNIIAMFSKYAWSRPLKKKNGIKVCRAFEDIIKDAIKIDHKSPNFLHTDEGLEFKNKDFNSLLNKYKIKWYHSKNKEKRSIVKSYSRTKKNRIKVIFEINKNVKWIDNLENIFRF